MVLVLVVVVEVVPAEVVIVVLVVAVVVVLGVVIGIYVMVVVVVVVVMVMVVVVVVPVAVQTCPAAFGPAVRAVWVLPCPLTSSVDGLLHSDKLPFTFCPLSPRRSSVSVFVFPSPSGGDVSVILQSGSSVVGHGS